VLVQLHVCIETAFVDAEATPGVLLERRNEECVMSKQYKILRINELKMPIVIFILSVLVL